MKQMQHKILLFLLLGLNIFFFRESLVWFYKVFIGLHDLFNSVFILLLLFFIVKNTSLKDEQFRFNYKVLPLLICGFSVLGYYLAEIFIQINILSFILFLIYVFGFLGFLMPTQNWKKYIIPFCLLIMALPFGNILDLYVGFPLRIVSVNLVSLLFESFNINHVSVDTIITIENNSSMVDFSCSGIKGLWAALIFYFTNTWLKNYKIGLKWFLLGGILLSLIVMFNIIRILILVYFDLVLELPVVSNIIHVPLGIFGFVFSCVVIYFLSGYLLESKPIKSALQNLKKYPIHFSFVFILLPVLQIVFSFNIYEPKTIEIHKEAKYFNANFIKDWNINKVKKSNEESKFVSVNGGKLHKFSFFNTDVKGNGFVFKSSTWRSHHNPEYCITSGGVQITESETLKINNKDTIKKFLLDNGQEGYYWFQNKRYTTDDFGTRVWNEIFKRETDWILVCVIFNSNKNENQKKNFIQQIKNQL